MIKQIQDMIETGWDWDEIAHTLDIPYSWVVDAHNMLEENYNQD